MSINDMMKLQGVGATKPLASGVQNGIENKRVAADSKAHSARQSGAAQDGIAVEVAAKVGAGEPPVSADRVREVRNALEDGTYPIVPAKIADAMIAAQLSLAIKS